MALGGLCHIIDRFDTWEDRELLRYVLMSLRSIMASLRLAKIALEYGVLGVVAYSLIIFLFARMCGRYYKYENDPYWKAFAAGSLGFAFSMLFFFFAYRANAF